MARALYLGTTLTRGADVFDIMINLEISTYYPPTRDTRDTPGRYRAEFEFDVTSIEFDVGRDDHLPAPLTDDERDTLTAWFEANHDRACEVAGECLADERE